MPRDAGGHLSDFANSGVSGLARSGMCVRDGFTARRIRSLTLAAGYVNDDTVHEVSVVGRKSEQWGEEIVAFVVPVADKPVFSAELDQHCLDNIARFKRPKDYFLLKELPKNNYGKILKRTLRKQVNS